MYKNLLYGVEYSLTNSYILSHRITNKTSIMFKALNEVIWSSTFKIIFWTYIIPLSKYRNKIIEFNSLFFLISGYFIIEWFWKNLQISHQNNRLRLIFNENLLSKIPWDWDESSRNKSKHSYVCKAIVWTSNFFRDILMVFKLLAFEIPRFSFITHLVFVGSYASILHI